MKFQNKLCPWTITQILIHTWKFTVGSSASCYTHWFKCQCSPPSYLCTLNVWHEQGHCGEKKTSYSWVTTKGTCHTCWKGLVGHKFCCMIKPICGIRSIKQMIKKTTRISQTHLQSIRSISPDADKFLGILLQHSEDVEMGFVQFIETPEWILFFFFFPSLLNKSYLCKRWYSLVNEALSTTSQMHLGFHMAKTSFGGIISDVSLIILSTWSFHILLFISFSNPL